MIEQCYPQLLSASCLTDEWRTDAYDGIKTRWRTPDLARWRRGEGEEKKKEKTGWDSSLTRNTNEWGTPTEKRKKREQTTSRRLIKSGSEDADDVLLVPGTVDRGRETKTTAKKEKNIDVAVFSFAFSLFFPRSTAFCYCACWMLHTQRKFLIILSLLASTT